jgi:hypothetical protein
MRYDDRTVNIGIANITDYQHIGEGTDMLSQASLGATNGLQNLLNQENIGNPSQRSAMASSLDKMACSGGSDAADAQNMSAIGSLIVGSGGATSQSTAQSQGSGQTNELMQMLLLMMLMQGGMGTGGTGMGGGGIDPLMLMMLMGDGQGQGQQGVGGTNPVFNAGYQGQMGDFFNSTPPPTFTAAPTPATPSSPAGISPTGWSAGSTPGMNDLSSLWATDNANLASFNTTNQQSLTQEEAQNQAQYNQQLASGQQMSSQMSALLATL